MNKNIKSIILTLILATVYVSLSVFLTIVNYLYPQFCIDIFNVAINIAMVDNCIGSCLFTLSILITVLSSAKYFKVSLILQLCNLIIINNLILSVHHTEIIASSIMTLFGIFINVILNKYICIINKNELNLDKLSFTDPLTGLANRRALIQKMEFLKNANKSFFLLFCDIDNFKLINDTLGHDKGDDLLRFIANKWSCINVDVDYTVYRLGGDEFAMIVNTTDEDVTMNLASSAINGLGTKDSVYYTNVSASIGYAQFLVDTKSIDDLLSYADTAMYKAKTSGKNKFLPFDKSMYTEIVYQQNIEQVIKARLADNNLNVYYQPQFNLKKDILGYEAFLRIPGLEHIDTKDIIHVAEKSRLIFDIDRWVLNRALKDTVDIVKSNPNITISVNVSGKHIGTPNFLDDVLTELVNNSDFPKKNLIFEITESTYIKNISQAVDVVSKIKAMGCQVALDDFGTGFSSLNYIDKLPIDIIKIDKKFVQDTTSAGPISMAEAIIKICNLYNIKTVAEGVETEEQLNRVKSFGCGYVQGFIWGIPLPIEDIR